MMGMSIVVDMTVRTFVIKMIVKKRVNGHGDGKNVFGGSWVGSFEKWTTFDLEMGIFVSSEE